VIQIRPRSDVPIHRQISDGVRMAVSTGRLQIGDELPSVRGMAVRLRVNPNTVARAYRDLEAQGVLETRRGRGTYISRQAGRGSKRGTQGVIEAGADEFVEVARQGGMSDEEIVKVLKSQLTKNRRKS
jgi:GntR family transcriptional regulator